METILVPSKERSMWEPSVVALVPPLRTGRMPDTWVVRETCPVRFESERQLAPYAKQPVAREMPLWKVEVAAPVCARFRRETLPLNVDVEMFVTLREALVVVPALSVEVNAPVPPKMLVPLTAVVEA